MKNKGNMLKLRNHIRDKTILFHEASPLNPIHSDDQGIIICDSYKINIHPVAGNQRYAHVLLLQYYLSKSRPC